MLEAKLVVVGGVADRREVNLKSLPLTIGRGKDVSLTLSHQLVSRKHCRIFSENDLLHVEDLSSLNGTYVNNKQIEGIQTLEPGQLLTLGNVTFRAVYETPAETVGLKQQNEEDTNGNGFEELDTDHNRPIARTDQAHKISKPHDTDWAPPLKSESVLDDEPVIVENDLAPEKSISVSKIHGLEVDEPVATDQPDVVQIDIADENPAKASEDDQALGSFLRKAK